jgi:hypothetical protein
MHGSVQESFDEQGFSGSVVLMCAWSARHDLVADILSNLRPWPSFTGWSFPARARSASIKPLETQYAVADQSIIYNKALVTVNYRNKLDESEATGGIIFTESIEPVAQNLLLDPTHFRLGNAEGRTLKDNECPTKIDLICKIVRTLYRLPTIPAQAFNNIYKTNDSAYSSVLLGKTFPEDTLLFQPPRTSLTVTTSGTEGYDLGMEFVYCPDGWNKFWNPLKAGGPGYDILWDVFNDREHKNHEQGDFSSLLF